MSIERIPADGLDITIEAFPVGSVYINALTDTNPNAILGYGVWEKFSEGKFLLGDGGGYTAGQTGGVENVTLTTSQIPSHSHDSGNLSTTIDGDHSHSGNTSNTGSHSHGGNTSNIGNHTHSYQRANHTGNSAGTSSTRSPSNSTRNTGGSGSHSHNISTNITGAHSHNISTNNTGAHSHNITGSTGANGSGEAHTNMPPYIVAYMWLRTE